MRRETLADLQSVSGIVFRLAPELEYIDKLKKNFPLSKYIKTCQAVLEFLHGDAKRCILVTSRCEGTKTETLAFFNKQELY
jgi:hypothetical protein